MKRFYLLVLMVTLALSSVTYAEYSNYSSDECGAYEQKLEHERNKLDNFED